MQNAPYQSQGELAVHLHRGDVGEAGQRDADGEGDPVDDKEVALCAMRGLTESAYML
ncbi:hypothetical protein PV735_26080 [Streptomyces turgidiscabies]|uniref:hypothetical protein n=1 Tax=Streptomyces TaxID=1883 RepID=UPI0015C5156D|nr:MULTISPECIES: hypothetical protein [Streptomyces]MDX3496130.1 hypothetical protein [Streptomyces turgidiscabies]